jgi:pimeloyl-ACP methyl ester carboxylesterase
MTDTVAANARGRARRWGKRGALVLAVLAVLAWGSTALYLYFRQVELVYLPTREWARSPADAGLAFEDFRLAVKRAGRTPDKGRVENINAWWLPAPAPNGMSVLFLHGNARNMGATGNVEKVVALARAGFNVMTLDYRGYGKSDGDAPYEAALYEDAAAALAEFRRRAPDASRRVLHGHSMGGAVAIELATKRPREFAAAFIEATFTDMFEMSTLNPLYRLLPIDTLLTERFESARKISGFALPVLFIHGTGDQRIPLKMSQQLYARAPDPKSLIVVNGATHNNLHTFVEYAGAYRLLLEMAKK